MKHTYSPKSGDDISCKVCDELPHHRNHIIGQIDRHQHVDHPAHYGGANNTYEAIKVIEAWDLGFCLGNAIKYICRAGKKPRMTGAVAVAPSDTIEDLEKAKWYLNREIERLKSSTTATSSS